MLRPLKYAKQVDPNIVQLKLCREPVLKNEHAKTLFAYFRNITELPYISIDRSYDFNYQETRMLPEERQLLPGDSVQVVCDYKTKGIRENLTVVSFSKKFKNCCVFTLAGLHVSDPVLPWSSLVADLC